MYVNPVQCKAIQKCRFEVEQSYQENLADASLHEHNPQLSSSLLSHCSSSAVYPLQSDEAQCYPMTQIIQS
jgi:hypothetical protein